MSGSQNPTRCENILEIPNIPWLSLEALVQLPCSALVWLLRGAIKHQPGQNPTFGWVSSGQGMEKSIRSSSCCLAARGSHASASAACASQEAGLRPSLQLDVDHHLVADLDINVNFCQHRLMTSHQKSGDVLWRPTPHWFPTIKHPFHTSLGIPPSSLFAPEIWAVRTFMGVLINARVN